MRKFLALALVVVMMLALVPTAFAAPTIFNGKPGDYLYFGGYSWMPGPDLDATQKALIGWASTQDIGKFRVSVVDIGDTLLIVGKYADFAKRGDDYVPYIDIPLYLVMKQGAFAFGTGTTKVNDAKISITMTGGNSTSYDVLFSSGQSLGIDSSFKFRFYPQQLGNSAEIIMSYSDSETKALTGGFWNPSTTASSTAYLTKKIQYVDGNTAVTNGNAVTPVLLGDNANRGKAVWDPDTNDVRVHADFTNFKTDSSFFLGAKKIEKQVVLDIKLTLSQPDGTPYPPNTSVYIEPYLESSFKVADGSNVYTFTNSPDSTKPGNFEMEIIWENDREGYLDKNGAATFRFYFNNKVPAEKGPDENEATLGDTHKILARLANQQVAKPRFYIRNAVTGVYTEKTFPILFNNSYNIPANSISIIGGDFSLKVGETKSLNVLYGDANTLDKNVVWYSSDANVASVTTPTVAGAPVTVTAKKVGTTVINARTSVSDKYESYVICTVVPDIPEPPVVSTATYVVVCNALNKRTGPGTSFSKVAPTLKRGDTIEVIEVVGGWAKYEIGGKVLYSSLGDGKYLQLK